MVGLMKGEMDSMYSRPSQSSSMGDPDLLDVDGIKTPEDLNTPDINDSVFDGELDWESELTLLYKLSCHICLDDWILPSSL